MANVVLNFNAFLEQTKLKDDGSNYTDWVRNLRIILNFAFSRNALKFNGTTARAIYLQSNINKQDTIRY